MGESSRMLRGTDSSPRTWLAGRLMHRRQWRLGAHCPGAVVESDDADVAGDAAAGLAQDFQGARGHRVGGGEDPVDGRLAVEQRAHALDPVRVVVERDLGNQVRVEPGAERLAEAGQPVGAGVPVERRGDHADPAPAGAGQLLGDRAGASDVVDADERDALVQVGRVADERGRQADLGDQPGDRVVRAGRDDDRAVHEAAAEIPRDPLRVAVGVDDEADHLMVGDGEDGVGAEHDGADVRVLQQQRR